MGRIRMVWFDEAWMGTTGPDFEALWRLAEAQDGYFTNAEARRCGFRRSLLSRHAGAGPFVHVRRGLYRMRDHPEGPYDPIRIEWMAAGRRWAVVSQGSALFLHDLVDAAPGPVNLTLPRGRRWYAPGRVRIHLPLAFPPETEITKRKGIRVTGSERSLVDAVEEGIQPEELAEAVRRAIERDEVDPRALVQRARSRSSRVGRSVTEAIEEARKR